LESLRINITGLVQGVGFRPFVFRAAQKNNLTGWVRNTIKGVEIHIEGVTDHINKFLKDLTTPPVIAEIITLKQKQVTPEFYQTFEILESSGDSEEITRISPDIAVCNDCLNDAKTQLHRINYPFINCTNCGPRFTIIKAMPYDRVATSMDVFGMCELCENEYQNTIDRRFHAQPIACNNCGPSYTMHLKNKVIDDFNEILTHATFLINEGNVIMLKGTGGFHLICNALNEEAVGNLRSIKHREKKPFAVMFRDLETIIHFNHITDNEIKSLTSWKCPITLLSTKQPLAPSVNAGFKTTGAILPYVPMHHMLFEKLNTPALVFTSANFTNEPVITENNEALEKLESFVDAIITYNRDIINRTDDSVCQVVNNKERTIRRSRGYVPIPVQVKYNVEGILAVGAELISCFCIGKGHDAILSQYIGDLKNYSTYTFFTETIEKFQILFSFKPKLIVHDLHPDYFSTRYAVNSGAESLAVQHHHAHIASCMAEHGLDEKVIGVCFDGTGFGTDGNLWGSEFFIADFSGYDRLSHFEYIPLPGGEQAIKEPWRIAISYLYKYYGKDIWSLDLTFLKNIEPQNINLIISVIDKQLNSPLACGAGRVFDAVAALLNLCLFSNFEAEAPMRLEDVILDNCDDFYPLTLGNIISFESLFSAIINDLNSSISTPMISTKFHNSIVEIIVRSSINIRSMHGLNKVVLSGGTFQNRYLLEKTEKHLKDNRFDIYSPCLIPTNDGGIALGQLMIGAKKREEGLAFFNENQFK
jgi:hydrogenase maturation protein HypF